ncbi:S1C family serine protease [uncultured Vagococcus sp.]|uniref:S1C family serine protease n=1 Tax=uncultured Vagococcus sp. TaxID=189676 RepID=UPI0028CFE0C0|nr:S1C family serine protease [uncultured Vagococcus sp.]
MKKGKGAIIGYSLLGGMLGALIICGILIGLVKNDTITLGKSETSTSNVTYKVNSDVTKMVGEVKETVVSIINLQSGNQSLNDLLNQEGTLQAAGEGSGVIYKIEGNQAYIVTNNHVVAGADAVEVLMKDGTTEKVEVVGLDTFTDLAVLKMSSEHVTKAAEFADSSKVQVGEPAIAIGSPLGSMYANSVTQGIVSAVERTITNKTDDGELTSINAIQTDAAINPGNSGGALLNVKGQVIGINSIKIAEASVEGMGFAIPSNDVIKIIAELEKNGKIERPFLGVTPYNLFLVNAETRKQALDLPDDVATGVVVLEVQAGSPAAAAKLAVGDVIVGIDGEAVDDNVGLQTLLYQYQIGDKIKVEFYRGQEKQTATVELKARSGD